jgi:hypothetical protein
LAVADYATRGTSEATMSGDFSPARTIRFFGLGPVERGVGFFQKRVQIVLSLHTDGHAAADCGVDPMPADKLAIVGKRKTDAFGAQQSHFDACCRQHRRKFFATHAAEQVGRPQCADGAMAKSFQHGVANRMTVFVVDIFEMIEVEHDRCNRRLAAPARLQNSLCGLQESGAIGDAGERVRPCGRPRGHLLALVDQREYEDRGAEGEDSAFEVYKSKQAHERRHRILSGRANEGAVGADQQGRAVHCEQNDERPACR